MAMIDSVQSQDDAEHYLNVSGWTMAVGGLWRDPLNSLTYYPTLGEAVDIQRERDSASAAGGLYAGSQDGAGEVQSEGR